MNVKGKRLLKNGKIGGYVKQKNGSWKWKILEENKCNKEINNEKKMTEQKNNFFFENDDLFNIDNLEFIRNYINRNPCLPGQMEIKDEIIRIFDKQIRLKSQELFNLQNQNNYISDSINEQKNNNQLSSSYDINPIQELNNYQNYNLQNNQYYQQQDFNNLQNNQYQQQNDFNNLQNNQYQQQNDFNNIQTNQYYQQQDFNNLKNNQHQQQNDFNNLQTNQYYQQQDFNNLQNNQYQQNNSNYLNNNYPLQNITEIPKKKVMKRRININQLMRLEE